MVKAASCDGIAFWAHSVCRSAFALYREVGRQAGVPVKIAVWKASKRGDCGFSEDEFADLDVVRVGDDAGSARRFLEATAGWLQVFSTYQVAPAYRRAIAVAQTRGDRLIAYAEAPSNMACGGLRWMKEVYLRTVLPWRCRRQIAAFGKLICASGDNFRRAMQAGWPREKIVPFGYAVPPFRNEGAGRGCREGRGGASALRILATGAMTWHRGADVFVRAMRELTRRGVAYEAVVTQDGPMRETLEATVRRGKLPVRFAGKVSVGELARLYRSCDVFVAAGREEPWGIRVNDAVNCGAPVVVSDGMGAKKIVEDAGCGCVVPAGDAGAIADCLERMAREPTFLARLRSAVPGAAALYSVGTMAERFLMEAL